MVPETLINGLVTLVTIIPGVTLKENTLAYLIVIALIVFLPLILALIVGLIYVKVIDRDSYDQQWVKTGLLLLGFRYTMKWLTMMLFDKRRR